MTNDPLKHPRAELAAASRAIVAMQNAKTMDEFESDWRGFLNCLEKIWQKVERSCQPMRNTFEPWQGTYHGLRKKDMLLRYLKQARDADNHSIQDVAKIQPGSMGYKFINPNGGYIKHMEIKNGQVVHYEGDPMIVEETPPHPVAIAVKNNGEWFNPPTSHLGQAIPNHHPVTLAELGLKFYAAYIDEVESKFYRPAAI